MEITGLKDVIQSLPENAPEPVVRERFMPLFMKALGFDWTETAPEFDIGGKPVDYAARHNTSEDRFIDTRTNPFLYVEVKGQDTTLTDNHSKYTKTVNQLKGYLLGSRSESVQWGVITNSRQAQLFRKHGRVIYPVTPCMDCADIEKVITTFRTHITATPRALTVTIYNNKGGVGKTTTTINLAAALTIRKKKVLIIDFDPNQQDLGDSLNMKSQNSGNLLKALSRTSSVSIRDCIQTYKYTPQHLPQGTGFDVILPDTTMVSDQDDVDLKKIGHDALLDALIEVKAKDYDYILIDAPPNWQIFSQCAVYAADVVLMPARHDNLHSLQNAAMAVTDLLPQAQKKHLKYSGAGPAALPIFLNGVPSNISHVQSDRMHNAIKQLIASAKTHKQIDLTPFFYPKWTPSRRRTDIAKIRHFAHIARADFLHIPAVFGFKVVYEQYLDFIEGYFLWD